MTTGTRDESFGLEMRFFSCFLKDRIDLFIEGGPLNLSPFSSLSFSDSAAHNRFMHIEGECPFIDFAELLDRIEDLVCDVTERVLNHPLGHLVQELNPVSQMERKTGRSFIFFS